MGKPTDSGLGSRAGTRGAGTPDDALFGRVASILEQARGNVVRAVNHNMVVAYWLIGREIVMELQRGQERAGYGDVVIKGLSQRMTKKYGSGWSETNLQRFRLFFVRYAARCVTIPATAWPKSGDENLRDDGESLGFNLSWSHYRVLMRVESASARLYYETEADRGGWSVRVLERQIQTQSYERLGHGHISAPGLLIAQNTPSSGSSRVNRGGSWIDGARGVLAAFRSHDAPGARGFYLGFRLARSLS